MKKNPPRSRRRIAAFTLVELMIVVAVVAILASIALPSYNESMRKSRRAQAKADIVEYAQVAERFFTANNTYVGFNAASGLSGQSPREAGATARYTVAYAATATTFTITATPTGSQATDRCGTLSINQAAAKTRSGSVPLSDCW